MQNAAAARLALAQGAFYVGTGVWPLVHLRSFEAVTGPKPEGWLVKTVGLLITVLGAGLLYAGRRGRVTPELRLMAVGSALSLAAVDLYYAGLRRRIAPVYLLDAVAELGLVGAWALTSRRRPAAAPSVRPGGGRG